MFSPLPSPVEIGDSARAEQVMMMLLLASFV
jgi:hypothetical protein